MMMFTTNPPFFFIYFLIFRAVSVIGLSFWVLGDLQ